MGKNKKLKTIIIILAVLLGVSIAALAGTLIYNHFAENQPLSVVVPENIITPETENSESSGELLDIQSTGPKTDETNPSENETDSNKSAESMGSDSSITVASSNPESNKTAAALYLYDRNPGDNTPFKVGNMFPGDKETKYYCVKVSHKDTVTVHFRADIRPGYEKLAEVMKCRVILLSTGEILYDGLMRDMPESVNHTLKTDKKTASELYYEITAYLDTSVGNEYMEKDLIADFRWWVPETENLEPSPQTGETSNIALWVCLAASSLFMLIILLKKQRKEDEKYER